MPQSKNKKAKPAATPAPKGKSKPKAEPTLTSAQRKRVATAMTKGLKASGGWVATVCKLLFSMLKGSPVAKADRDEIIALVKPRDKYETSRLRTLMRVYARMPDAMQAHEANGGAMNYHALGKLAVTLKANPDASASQVAKLMSEKTKAMLKSSGKSTTPSATKGDTKSATTRDTTDDFVPRLRTLLATNLDRPVRELLPLLAKLGIEIEIPTNAKVAA